MERLDLTGKKFGRLTVINFVKWQRRGNRTFWLCVCDCGKEIITDRGNLKRGTSKSCGCLQKELISKRQSGEGNVGYKHGLRYNRIYKIFYGMYGRCKTETNYQYGKYGGRGIKCLWNSLKEFTDDMKSDYLEHVAEYGDLNTTLDRIDNNGNYCKENCRWATRKQQQNNTRVNRIVEFEGNDYTISEMYDKLEPVVSLKTFASRVIKLKWDIKKATTQPIPSMRISRQ